MNKDLTDKQKLYMHCLASGFSNKQIADKMNITIDSVVSNYQERMLSKTYLSTRKELVEYAKQNGYGEENGQ
jgi:DNA-binding NarL/FixJ family response regulator